MSASATTPGQPPQPERGFTLKLFDTRAQMNEIQAHCRANGIVVSDGLIIRAMLGSATQSPELLGLIESRQQKEKENERRGSYERKKKRSASR